MEKKFLAFAVTHLLIVSFVLYHLATVVNWYVVNFNALQLFALASLAFLIPKKWKKYYFVFVLYYFLTTSTWFNNWIIALPNYLAKGCLAFGVCATVAALLSLWINVSIRKLLMVGTFITGTLYALVRSAELLTLHLSFALTFLVSLFGDFHFLVWAVNYITYLKRLREGTV